MYEDAIFLCELTTPLAFVVSLTFSISQGARKYCTFVVPGKGKDAEI